MKRISKKFLAYAVTAAMILPTVSFAQITPEIQNHWAKDTISKWLDRGYIVGDGQGNVNPDKKISRAEFITMVNKAFGYTGEAKNHFVDVNEGEWFYKQVIIALANDYIKGISDTQFAPMGIITREQACVIIAKIKNLPKADTGFSKFTDKNKVSAWALEYVKSMIASGIMSGYPDNTIGPQNELTRSEAIILLDKALQYNEKTNKDENKPAPGTYASKAGKLNAPSKVEVKSQKKLTFAEKKELLKKLMEANKGKHIKEFVVDDEGNVTEVIFEDGSVIKKPEELKASAIIKEKSSGGGGGGGGGSYGGSSRIDADDALTEKLSDDDLKKAIAAAETKYNEEKKTANRDLKEIEEKVKSASGDQLEEAKRELAKFKLPKLDDNELKKIEKNEAEARKNNKKWEFKISIAQRKDIEPRKGYRYTDALGTKIGPAAVQSFKFNAQRVINRLNRDVTVKLPAGTEVKLDGQTEPQKLLKDMDVTLKPIDNKAAWDKALATIPEGKKYFPYPEKGQTIENVITEGKIKEYVTNVVLPMNVNEIQYYFDLNKGKNGIFEGWDIDWNSIKNYVNPKLPINSFTFEEVKRVIYDLKGGKIEVTAYRTADNGNSGQIPYTIIAEVKLDNE